MIERVGATEMTWRDVRRFLRARFDAHRFTWGYLCGAIVSGAVGNLIERLS